MSSAGSAIAEAPPLDGLFSEIRDDRKGRKEAAIIIPTFSAQDLLKKHLDKLSKQDTGLFDILIVYGMDDRFIETPHWAGILHLRRSWDFGSAGAFFAGEKKAVAEGYDKIILADDDCFPVSSDLVKKICQALDGSMIVKPRISLPPRIEMMETVLPQYGGIRREAFEKAGYSYLPLYSGGEDLDLEERLCAEYGPATRISETATHPWFMPPLLGDGYTYKIHNFGHGGAAYRHALGKHYEAFKELFFRGLKMAACAVVGRSDLTYRYAQCTRLEYERILGFSKLHQVRREKSFIPTTASQGDAEPEDFDKIFEYTDFERDAWSRGGKAERVPRRFGDGEGIGKKANGIAKMSGVFNKIILFEGWFSEWDLKYSVLSRRTALRDNGRTYWVSKERDRLAILIGIGVMILAVPVSASIAGGLTVIAALNNTLKSRRSIRYGAPR